mmetsp:Transcript_33090/g.37992  ORF Transcript_33090/g.37992 Transcript_33090/m.37992 type:complete len:217 (-) Transcript_33090:136-786(-)
MNLLLHNRGAAFSLDDLFGLNYFTALLFLGFGLLKFFVFEFFLHLLFLLALAPAFGDISGDKVDEGVVPRLGLGLLALRHHDRDELFELLLFVLDLLSLLRFDFGNRGFPLFGLVLVQPLVGESSFGVLRPAARQVRVVVSLRELNCNLRSVNERVVEEVPRDLRFFLIAVADKRELPRFVPLTHYFAVGDVPFGLEMLSQLLLRDVVGDVEHDQS